MTRSSERRFALEKLAWKALLLDSVLARDHPRFDEKGV